MHTSLLVYRISLGTATGSDSDGLDQLEKMRAELMSKLEDDFKLSPEEDTDSEDGEFYRSIFLNLSIALSI